VFTQIGPVEVEVPRDTNISLEPSIVKKRQRRLTYPLALAEHR
jgi:putative transposase